MAKMGRPRKVFDWDQVDKLCHIHCTEEEIAAFCECDIATLYKACLREKKTTFTEYYRQRAAHGKMSLRRRMYVSAVEKENTTMMIWLSKQKSWLGFSDKIEDVTEQREPAVLKIQFEEPSE